MTISQEIWYDMLKTNNFTKEVKVDRYYICYDTANSTWYVSLGSEAGKRSAINLPNESTAMRTARDLLRNKCGGYIYKKDINGKFEKVEEV